MTDIARLGLAVDSTPVATAANDLDQLTNSAQRAEAAARRLSSVQVAPKVSITGQLQQEIDRRLSIGAANDVTARAADIQAYGAELDRLRAKFSPLFALQQRYRMELMEINNATRVGAISEDERAAAIERTKAAFAGQIALMRGVTNATIQAAAAQRLSSFQMQNMQFQMQDIAVMLASGANPFLVIMQQGSQIAQSFGAGTGVLAALKATGAGIMSFLTNPLNLAVLAIASASGAVFTLWNSIGGSESKTAEDRLQEHRKIVSEIKAAYGEAAVEAGRFTAESKMVMDFLRRESADALREILSEAQRAVADTAPMMVGRGGIVGRAAVAGAGTDDARVKAAIDELRRSAAQGQPDIQRFRAALAEIGNLPGVSETLRGRISELLELTKVAAEAERELNRFNRTRQEIEQEGMAALSSYTISLEARESRQRQLNDLELQGIRARSPAERARIAAERERIGLIGEEMTAAERALRIEHARNTVLAEGAHAASESARERQLAAAQNIASAELELVLMGRTAGEQERLRAEFQAISQIKLEAARTGIAANEAEIESIKRTAAEMGRLRQAIAEASLQREIMFEREQLFRTPQEQGIASRLRSVFGDDTAGPQAQFLGNQLRINNALQQGIQYATTFAQGFRADIMNGATALEALGNGLTRITGQLADMALQFAANQLFSAIFGGLTGGLGGGSMGFVGAGGTPIPGINPFFQHDGRRQVRKRVNPMVFAGLGINRLAAGEYPTVLHESERVVPRGGGDVRVEMPIEISGGGSDTETARAVREMARTLPSKIISTVKEAQSRRIL